MGFVPPEKSGLVHGEGDYAGFEARVRIAPVPLSLSLGLTSRFESGDAGEMLAAIREFGDAVLIEWNVDAPATGAGLLSQDVGLSKALIIGWSEALAQPPLASDVPPVNGRTSGQGRSRRNGHVSSSSTASVNGGAARPRSSSRKTQH